MGQQQPVRAGDVEVVVLDQDHGEDGIKQRPAPRPVGRVRQLDADQQLGHGDGGDGDVVVADQIVETDPSTFSGDHDRRVEDQPVQSRSSVISEVRSVASSSGHDESETWSRSSRLTSSPLVDGTGVIRAIGLPPRVTT